MISQEYVERLSDAARVDYYVSGNDGGRVYWPWRMQKAGGQAGCHTDQCETYILDSNFTDESVTNADVLAEAHDVGADAAVLADVLGDPDATVRALQNGLDSAREHDFSGVVVLPTQPPHDRVAKQLKNHTHGLNIWWGVGGVKDAPAGEKIDAARQLRAVVGDDAHIHGLGFGVTQALAAAVRDQPNLLNSIDNSTAMQNASVTDLEGKKEKMTVAAARATAERLRRLRMLTDFADEQTPTKQLTTAAF
jgi:hypothetical protein